MKELQSNVETLSDKLKEKMRENQQLKQQIALGPSDTNFGGETQKRPSKSPLNTQLLAKDPASPANDRVGIIRSKLALLFAKMAKALAQMQESDDFLKEKNATLLGGMAGYRSKYSEQVLGFREDLGVLQNDYELLGKQYVNDAIDICQKTLKVYESLQTLNQKLRNKALERSQT